MTTANQLLRDAPLPPMSETTAEVLPPSPKHHLPRWRRVIPQRVASTFAAIATFTVAAREFRSVTDADLMTNPPLPAAYDRVEPGDATLRPLTFTDAIVAVIGAPYFIVRAFFGFGGDVEVSTAESWCDECEGVHAGEACPRLLHGDCSTCGQTVALDRYMQCAVAGDRWRYHAVTNIRPRAAAPTQPPIGEMVMSG